MKTQLICGFVAASALALSACAMTGKRDTSKEDATPLMSQNDAELQTYRIRDWSAKDDKTLLVKALDGSTYRAEFMGPCTGLRFSNTIGFVTHGLNELDKYSGIVLHDGTRCTFRSFQKLAFPEPSRSAEAPKETQDE